MEDELAGVLATDELLVCCTDDELEMASCDDELPTGSSLLDELSVAFSELEED